MPEPKFEDTEPVSFEDTSPIEEDVPSFEDTEEISEVEPIEATSDMTPSQIDKALESQGFKISEPEKETGTLEDIVTSVAGGTGLSKLSAGLGAAAAELTGDKPLLETSPIDAFYEGREAQRTKEEELFEKSPTTSIVGGIAGAGLGAMAGGAALSAAGDAGKLGKVGQLLDKVKNLKGLKGVAAQGALGGAVAGLTEGEAKLLEGEVGQAGKEVLTGTALGTLGSTALTGAGKAIKGVGKGLKSVAGILPGASDAKLGFKYGLSGKELTEEQVGKDLNKLSTNIYNFLNKNLKGLGLQRDELQQAAEEMGKTVNAGGTLEEAYQNIASKIELTDTDSKTKESVLKAIKILQGKTPELDDVVAKTQDDIIKKRLLDNAEKVASTRIDKKATAKAIKEGTQPEIGTEFVEEGAESVIGASDDIATMGKRIETPTIKEVDGELVDDVRLDTITSDATPFTPSNIKANVLPSGKPIASYEDLGTGKKFGKVGKEIPQRSDFNPEEMELSKVDSAIKLLNEVAGKRDTDTQKAAGRLAGELRDLSNEALEEVGGEEAGKLTSKLSKLKSAQEELGIDKRLSGVSDIDESRKAGKIRERIVGGSEAITQKRDRAIEQLDIATEGKFSDKYKSALEKYKALKPLVQKAEQEGDITRASLYRQVSAKVPAKAGKIISDSRKKINKIVESPDSIGKVARSVRSLGKTGQEWAKQLEEVANESTAKRTRVMFGLMQNPAFRDHLSKFDITDDSE